MGYGLGIDVGTTFTAAALIRDGTVEVVPLATNQVAVPSVIFAAGDELLYAGPAERRGAAQPLGLAREFKRRLGDPVPLMLSGSPYHADRLTALMAKWALDRVTEQIGSAPAHVVMTHPANWTEYQLGILRNALGDVGLGSAELLSEPSAAALDFAANADVAPGATVLVYDLGGGTFDVAVLRREGDTFEQLGEPAGIERLGGIDFDEAIFQYVRATLPAEALDAARQSAEGQAAISQLRRRCVDAKEALSSDVAADVPVMLPGYTTTVRITRHEFESMIRPMVTQTTELIARTLDRTDMTAADLGAVLLVGGSSRIPVVPQMVAEQIGLPVRVDAHPKLVVARGAARRAGRSEAVAPRRAAPPPRVSDYLDGDDDDDDGRSIAPIAIGAVAVVAALALGGWLLFGRGGDDDAGSAATVAPVVDSTLSPGSTLAVDPTTAGSTAGSATIGPTDPPATEPGGSTTLPTTPESWSFATGSPLASVKGPALVDDTVVFGSQSGRVSRVGAADGAVVWEQPIAGLVFSSPVVAGDAVYVGADDGVHALALTDGTTRWTLPGAAVRSSPAVVDGTVFVGSDDTNLYAIDAASGEVRWQTPLGGEVLSSPAVSDGVVYVGSFDGSLYALDATTGVVRWATPLGGQVWSSPAIADGLVYVGGNDRLVHALDAATGAEVWSFVTSDVVSSSPAVADGTVYIGSFDGRVYAIDAAIGGERWRYNTGNVVFSSPKVFEGTVYVGSHSGSMYALDAADGSVAWRFPTGAIVGTAASADAERVYFGSDNGNLYAVER